MDLVLDAFDRGVGDSFYAALPTSTSSVCQGAASSLVKAVCTYLPEVTLARDAVLRQSLSLCLITYLGIYVLYFSVATLSYYLIFDHRMKAHPRFLPNQIQQEIRLSMDSFAPVSVLTLPWFVADVRGWSKLYGSMAEGPAGEGPMGYLYMAASAGAFLLFTDYLIFWVHKTLHHPALYKKLHKPHHRFIIPTPFASHAFTPLDGYLNSLPYHFFVYLVPVHKYVFIGLFVIVNLWTIFIHDSDMICDSPLENYINGPSHHTLHHLHFNVNYGQYFTYADKLGGSFRAPVKGQDPLLVILQREEKRQLSGREGSGSEDEASGSEGSSDSGFEEGVGGKRKSE